MNLFYKLLIRLIGLNSFPTCWIWTKWIAALSRHHSLLIDGLSIRQCRMSDKAKEFPVKWVQRCQVPLKFHFSSDSGKSLSTSLWTWWCSIGHRPSRLYSDSEFQSWHWPQKNCRTLLLKSCQREFFSLNLPASLQKTFCLSLFTTKFIWFKRLPRGTKWLGPSRLAKQKRPEIHNSLSKKYSPLEHFQVFCLAAIGHPKGYPYGCLTSGLSLN